MPQVPQCSSCYRRAAAAAAAAAAAGTVRRLRNRPARRSRRPLRAACWPPPYTGFELGIKSMKPGGKRRIVVPPELGPPVGPATFFSAKQYEVFDVELRTVKTCRHACRQQQRWLARLGGLVGGGGGLTDGACSISTPAAAGARKRPAAPYTLELPLRRRQTVGMFSSVVCE